MNIQDFNASQEQFLDEQDNAFAQVWEQLRAMTNAQGPGRALLCDENRNENRSHCYD